MIRLVNELLCLLLYSLSHDKWTRTRGVESWTNQYCFLCKDRINTVSCARTESILFPVQGPVTRGVESWTNQYCFLCEDRINTVSCARIRQQRSWVVNESILFPVLLLTELMQLPPAMWRERVLHENERIISVSCCADWVYAAAACHVAKEGTASKWPNHSLRRLVTPESYKRLVHIERIVRERHITTCKLCGKTYCITFCCLVCALWHFLLLLNY